MYRKFQAVKTVLVTGGIGSGKTEVCRVLASRGVPVYDSDSRTKSLYDLVPGLAEKVDAALGGGLLGEDGRIDRKRLASAVFSDAEKLRTLEAIVHPAVLEDFLSWRGSQDSGVVVMESAIAHKVPVFEGVFDYVVLVEAPAGDRLERAVLRDSSSREAVGGRMAQQTFDGLEPDFVIVNDSTLDVLRARADEALEKISIFAEYDNKLNNKQNNKMKTDLSRILSVSGQHGLYQYTAQARNGVIAESLADKKRVLFDVRSRITTLADIAIYTSEGEMKLRDVFEALHQVLGDADAPSSKASADEIKALFLKAVPDYDSDRFYISHMKKVVEWYNDLKNNASLEFATEEDAEAEAEQKAEDTANE